MDEEYLFLCPSCKKLTFGIGSGDVIVDAVQCRICKETFTSYYCVCVDEAVIKLESKVNYYNKVNKLYLTDKNFAKFFD